MVEEEEPATAPLGGSELWRQTDEKRERLTAFRGRKKKTLKHFVQGENEQCVNMCMSGARV